MPAFSFRPLPLPPPPPHLLTPPRRLHSWPSPPGKLLLSQRGTFTKREEEEEVSNKPQRSPLSQLDFTFLYIEQSDPPSSSPHRLTHLLPDLQPDPTPHPPPPDPPVPSGLLLDDAHGRMTLSRFRRFCFSSLAVPSPCVHGSRRKRIYICVIYL